MVLESVSDTARWVAMYRAMETERRDAIFSDPYARQLAGARGEAIIREMPRGTTFAWAMIVRTAIFDELILSAVRTGAIDLVINLAAGLDARPWRLSLPPTLRWVDMDLEPILRYKVETLSGVRPACVYGAIPADLTNAEERAAMFARVGADSARTLVITEGLLIYLSPAQVADLATALHAQHGVRLWLTDLGSPRLLAIMNRHWGGAVAAAGAPFQFAPEEGAAFFRPFGWSEREFRSTMEEAARLHREMRGMWLWRALARLFPGRLKEARRMSGTLLLERL